MEIQGYTLLNKEKVERALNGTPRGNGSPIGGIARGVYFNDETNVWMRDGSNLTPDEVSSLENSLLAEYDKLGGAIKRGGDLVKMGSFYDFKSNTPRSKPKVSFEFRVNGKVVEVPDGAELPGVVKAAKILEEEEAKVEETPKKKRSKK